MRSQSVLIVALIIIVLAVIGIVVFLPTTPPPHRTDLNGQQKLVDGENPAGISSPVSGGRSPNIDSNENNSGANGQNTAISQSITDDTDITNSGNPDKDATTSSSAQETPSPSDPNSTNSAAQTTAQQSIITGTVKDTLGKALQGAAIQAGEQTTVVTNTQGEFKIDGVNQKAVTITCLLAGYQTLKRDNVAAGTTNLTLVLVPEGAIAGRVMDQFGDPVAIAQIQGRSLKGIWAVETTADAEGRFVLSNAPQNRVRLQASQEGFTDSGAGTKELDLPSNTEVILRLNRPTFTITGRVIAEETQQGLSGFKLKAVLQDAGLTPEELIAESDGTGMYRFDNLRQGTYLVSSLASENAQLNYVIPLKDDFKSVRLYEKSASNVDFSAVSGRIVSGVVVNSNNQPVSNAEVTVAGMLSVQTVSNNNGQFRLTGVPIKGGQTIGEYIIRLQGSHTEYGTGFSDPLPSGEEREISGIQITLQGLLNLTGNVITRDNEPVGDVRVTLFNFALGQIKETRTSSNGQFTFPDVATSQDTLTTFGGTHEIVAEKENYSTIRQELVLKPGQQQTITLTMEQGGSIQGRVLDPNSQPLAGVNVTTQLQRGSLASASTDQYGVYVLSGLPEGAYDLHFRVDSDPPLTGVLYRIANGSTGADITLTAGKWDVMGTPVDAQTGQLIYQYMLSIEGTPKDPRGQHFVLNRQVNSPDGTYHVTFTEPGEYRFRFIAPNYEPFDGKSDISETTQRLQFINPTLTPLQTLGQIKGSFSAPEGMMLAGINIPGIQAFLTNGTSFVLNDIPAGNHDLIFKVYEQQSNSIFEMGVLLNIAVTGNQVTDLGQISPQNLTAHSRNF